MSHASTATITLGGASPTITSSQPQYYPNAPAPAPAPTQQGQGRRRRRRPNVPPHMQHVTTGSPANVTNQPRTGATDNVMTFGRVYQSRAPTQSSTPDQKYQTQSLFRAPTNKNNPAQAHYTPGPKQDIIDEQRAAEVRAKLKELSISDEQLAIYKRRFDVLDLNKDGVINLREFAAISRVLGYKFSKEEILDIFGKKDLDDSGGISFDEFVLAMYERAKKAKELAPYREKFRLFDWKNRGYITSDEAYPILKRELGFDENKTEMLIDLYDRNKDYRLSLLEFIDFYKKVEELKIQVHNAFRDFDRNGDGYVDPDEAKAVLLPKGFSDQQVEGLIYKYDKDGDGRLNYEEFAAFWDVQII